MAGRTFSNNIISVKCQICFFMLSADTFLLGSTLNRLNGMESGLESRVKQAVRAAPLLVGSVISSCSGANFDLNAAATASPPDLRNRQLCDILEERFDSTERNKKHFL